ncbi:uncharacterized protein PRCAT00005895001 [Priceomyces carsonii]|uniref:uncharacterized protein n=1 Tax=Priceomyces carsonii TaxID=28549 RepID=UPI002EDAF445|nr:unnamed protein product [Priceomyces carsonii]
MSSGDSNFIQHVLLWIVGHGFWNNLIEIRKGAHGIGVFQKGGNLQIDDILLRIPKSNILSPKNSYIYNLIYDYDTSAGSHLRDGIQGLVLSVIYELSLGDSSPWFDYLQSIDISLKSDNLIVPVCLWSPDDKHNLKNTDIDVLNIMDSSELVELYLECIRFAESCSKLLTVPKILRFNEVSKKELLGEYSGRLLEFGKIVQLVMSRAFSIDEYYDMSLVPGADLFNHIGPLRNENTIEGQENIEFVCDRNACSECGAIDCEEHSECLSDDEETNLPPIDEQFDCESCRSSIESQNEVPLKEITLEYIEELEKSLNEAEESLEKDFEDEDLEKDEKEDEEEDEQEDEEEDEMGKEQRASGDCGLNESDDSLDELDDDDLEQELADNSKCCDIILTKLPKEECEFEIFNSYGNDLSNTYLLQRYGFITDRNPNNSVLLTLPFLRYLKHYKQGLSIQRSKQVSEKFEWLRKVGFELLDNLVLETHKNQESGTSWELSLKVTENGCSLQTYVLLNLIELPEKFFKEITRKKEKHQSPQVEKYLLKFDQDRLNQTVKAFCQEKLNNYPELIPSPNYEVINRFVDEEKRVLHSFIENN